MSNAHLLPIVPGPPADSFDTAGNFAIGFCRRLNRGLQYDKVKVNARKALGSVTAPASSQPAKPVRVILQQPALPKYRLPVFSELARRPGIDLKVVYAEMPGLPNVQPSGFDGELVPAKFYNIGKRQAIVHGPQWHYAKRGRADVLILSWNLHYATLVPALLRARVNGVKTILWGHGYSRFEARTRSYLREKVARLADALLFYGDKTANAFVDAGWPRERVFVARNSLDQTAISAAREDWLSRPEELKQFRASVGIGPGPVILFVSRLIPENRVDLLVDAAARLRERHPTLQVVLVGGGDQEPLRSQARHLGIEDRLVFAGAVYEESKIAPYFLNADVFVYPAKLGLSIMHSFGYGVPMVTSALEEAQFPEREALVDGENGLTFTDGDPAALADAVDRILRDPLLRRSMSEAALRTIRERYSVSRMVDGFEAAIRYVSSGR